jgi:prepilin-type N-terminal cleavage/methylation domain-containing protein
MERLHSDEQGFGLVELLIAMTILAIGLMALVAAFSSSSLAINRSIQTATGASLADSEMESFRMMMYTQVGVDIAAGTLGALDNTYKNDSACYDSASATNCTQSGSPSTKKLTAPAAGTTCTQVNTWFPSTLPCTPSRTVTASDGRLYRVDTYVSTPTTAGGGAYAQRKRKQVAIVVRNGTTNAVVARESTTIDCATADPTNSGC